ncbi:pleiotropic drug resistance protein 2-like [Dorcoceras hygrometricum]|uniref:Pleiotropic drug resistance protein 2-like n=1 Tax=Dorcoceras hygrometricum TaxID=472368 RepID=A0A2Z7CJQ5_9LAMI|nr:pleiotropic drug resistance protein 2-like [Dorcoceras hygrometricum]
MAADDLSRAMSSSRRSWRSQSIREVWQGPPDVFSRNSTRRQEVDDEEELKWAAIERLPTYDRLRKGMLQQVMSNGKVVRAEVDVANLGVQDKKVLMESILKVVEEDNEKFLQRLRNRTDRVGIDIPKIEVRFQNLSIEGDAYVGTRALPTLLNSTLNTIEGALGMIGLSPSKKRVVEILKDVSGIVRPSRMTLLLGPPGSGKTTLLKALAGKADDDMRVTGKITYCGHEFHEFVPQRTCAYISQHDLHYGEMTVREILDFSGRCLGVGTRYDLLTELSRREKESGIRPDPEIDAFMKATAMVGQETSLITDYVLKVRLFRPFYCIPSLFFRLEEMVDVRFFQQILGLDICADILVGDEMRRGISGGQKKRVTTGEMLVGPAKAFFMDEISTGLDSSTTFQIVKFMRQMVHINDITMVISLLQPAPETYELFDDVILLSDGQIVYQGPREDVLHFFEYMGFKCPERKGVADFLQEVTSKKDQGQYWCRNNQPYQYISVPQFSRAFTSFRTGQQLVEELRTPYDKSTAHPAALVKQKYGISNWELFRACFAREWLLMKRSSFIYIFKTTQITIMATIALTVFLRTEMKAGTMADSSKFLGALFFSLINVMFNGMQELAMTVFRLPVFFKQRDSLFYPAWAFALPIGVLRVPISVMESGLWIVLTYYSIGFAPSPARFFKQFLAFIGVHQMALSLFRFIAAAGRTQVVANTLGSFTLLLVFVLGGFVVAKDDIQDWMIWGYYISPMMYGQNAIAINEFLSERWSTPTNGTEPTVGKTLLKDRGLFTTESWYWICIFALFGFTVLFNVLFIAALTYLNPLGDNKAVIADDNEESRNSFCVLGDLMLPIMHFTTMFVEEVMDLVELKSLRNALVGLPGVDGLSTEQRKRLTIAVELVSNPSIIFMDEPTSGLDARAAAIVMRTVRNTVDTGRTVVCTIHQPSIDIFEAFDEAIEGVPKIKVGTNPATWMLDVSSATVEAQHGVDFAEIYSKSGLYRRNQDLIKEISIPAPGSKDLFFPTRYSQSFLTQCKACFWKQNWSYWRNSQYNAIRFFTTIIIGIMFGVIFWQKGDKISQQQDLLNLLGATYSAVMFLGAANASAVQSVVAIERTVFYRERAAGLYSELPYAFAQVAIETLYVVVQTLVYSLLLYSMIGYHWTGEKFFYFYYFIFMCFTYFSMYGMMVVALTPGHQIAAIVMSFFLSFWNLFSGFLVPRPLIPIWWRWYYWASPVAWTIYGVFTSQLGDVTSDLELAGNLGKTTVKEFLKDGLGYDHDFLLPVVFAHVGWVLLFFFVFAYGIKFLNFQRR